MHNLPHLEKYPLSLKSTGRFTEQFTTHVFTQIWHMFDLWPPLIMWPFAFYISYYDINFERLISNTKVIVGFVTFESVNWSKCLLGVGVGGVWPLTLTPWLHMSLEYHKKMSETSIWNDIGYNVQVIVLYSNNLNYYIFRSTLGGCCLITAHWHHS